MPVMSPNPQNMTAQIGHDIRAASPRRPFFFRAAGGGDAGPADTEDMSELALPGEARGDAPADAAAGSVGDGDRAG
jgi:hypothetical protein